MKDLPRLVPAPLIIRWVACTARALSSAWRNTPSNHGRRAAARTVAKVPQLPIGPNETSTWLQRACRHGFFRCSCRPRCVKGQMQQQHGFGVVQILRGKI